MKAIDKVRRLAEISQLLKGLIKRADKIYKKHTKLVMEKNKIVKSFSQADRDLYAEKIKKYQR